MPQPDVRAQIVAGPLANVSLQYRNQEYVADRVFPLIDGLSPKAKITKYNKGDYFRDEAGVRAPGTRANRSGFKLSSVSLNTVQYAHAGVVTREDLRNQDVEGAPTIDLKTDAMELAADKIDLKKERIVSSYVRAQTWADGNSGGEDAAGGWAASSGNTFFADMRLGIKTIQKNSGRTPNKLLVDFQTYQGLLDSADVLDRLKITDNKLVTPQLVASLFDLDEVIIGKSIYSTANEKADGTDFTSQYIWETTSGKGMGFLFFAPSSPRLRMPSAGYQYRIKQDNGLARLTREWYEEAEDQWVFEVREETDIEVCGSDCGYLWIDTYAT
jgi:hypothetical protein